MRKRFLIKPSLQLRHLAWTLGMILFSCVCGYFLFESLTYDTLHALPISDSSWFIIKSMSRWGFALILTILLIAIGIENYLLFHKFVGPLFVIERGLKRIAEGDLTTPVQIRDSDELADLVEAFEEMRKEILLRLSSQEKLSELLALDVDQMLNKATQNNMVELREQLMKIREQIQKEAA